MQKWRSAKALKSIGGGAAFSILSGAASLLVVAGLQRYVSMESAALYLFASAFATLAGAALAMGIPEYGQVLAARTSSHRLDIPFLTICAAFLAVAAIGQRNGNFVEAAVDHSVYGLAGLSLTALLLTQSELQFRCRLLEAQHPRSYAKLSLILFLSSLCFYFSLEHAWLERVIGLSFLILMNFKIWRSNAGLGVRYEWTLFRLKGPQLGFYSQRLLLVYIDTSLIVSTHIASLPPDSYVMLGVLTRIVTPFFLLLNVHIGQRQAKLLQAKHTHQQHSECWHLYATLALVAIGLCSWLMTGNQSVTSIFISVTAVRLWVISLAVEFQQHLPNSPLPLIFLIFFGWAGTASVLRLEDAGLMVSVLFLVAVSFTIVMVVRLVTKWKIL